MKRKYLFLILLLLTAFTITSCSPANPTTENISRPTSSASYTKDNMDFIFKVILKTIFILICSTSLVLIALNAFFLIFITPLIFIMLLILLNSLLFKKSQSRFIQTYLNFCNNRWFIFLHCIFMWIYAPIPISCSNLFTFKKKLILCAANWGLFFIGYYVFTYFEPTMDVVFSIV